MAHEESDTFRTKGVAITGLGELVDNFSVGRKVLSQKTLGKQKEVVLFGELSKADQKIAMDNDIELSSPSLQDLFIYMTEEGGEKSDSKSNEICTEETS
jgi:ABC-2 type transport system ATP-binding protein